MFPAVLAVSGRLGHGVRPSTRNLYTQVYLGLVAYSSEFLQITTQERLNPWQMEEVKPYASFATIKLRC